MERYTSLRASRRDTFPLGDPELLGELDLGDVPGSAQLTERERILHRTLALSDVRIPVRIAFARPLAVR